MKTIRKVIVSGVVPMEVAGDLQRIARQGDRSISSIVRLGVELAIQRIRELEQEEQHA